MKVHLLYDDHGIIQAISTEDISAPFMNSLEVNNDRDWNKLICHNLPSDIKDKLFVLNTKKHSSLRIAFVCNWNDKCGISTYTKFLYDSLRPLVGDIKIFSEDTTEPSDLVVPCWKRGGDFSKTTELIKEWNPDFVIVQHEYGIFPNAFYFMQFLQSIKNTPYAVVMHSVYRHLDKAVYSEAARNIIVHSEEAKKTLEQTGNTNKVFVIPHGCVVFSETEELWNICHSPYTVIQFGFGFDYKGVDRAIQSIAHLKSNDRKFKDIQYVYLCSDSPHTQDINRKYCERLSLLAKELHVAENVVIIQKYQSEQMINLYLRLAKMAIFPYIIDPNNEVFGASGAIRIAMANKKPVIASESHLFDDLDKILPRPKNHIELAHEIDRIFSNGSYRSELVQKSVQFIKDNSWSEIAKKYLAVYDSIVTKAISV